jgi:hypothetical protein
MTGMPVTRAAETIGATDGQARGDFGVCREVTRHARRHPHGVQLEIRDLDIDRSTGAAAGDLVTQDLRRQEMGADDTIRVELVDRLIRASVLPRSTTRRRRCPEEFASALLAKRGGDEIEHVPVLDLGPAGAPGSGPAPAETPRSKSRFMGPLSWPATFITGSVIITRSVQN